MKPRPAFARKPQPTKASQRVQLEHIMMNRARLDLTDSEVASLSRCYRVSHDDVRRMAAAETVRRAGRGLG